MNNFHIMECIKELKDENTDIYVVNLKTKDVKELSAKTRFAMHHINAYEINDGNEIVLDMSPVKPMFMKEYPLLKKLLNPPEYSQNTIVLNDEITRYHINLETKAVTELKFPNLLKNATTSRYVNNFDLGTINEAYRGQKVDIYKYMLILNLIVYMYYCFESNLKKQYPKLLIIFIVVLYCLRCECI